MIKFINLLFCFFVLLGSLLLGLSYKYNSESMRISSIVFTIIGFIIPVFRLLFLSYINYKCNNSNVDYSRLLIFLFTMSGMIVLGVSTAIDTLPVVASGATLLSLGLLYGLGYAILSHKKNQVLPTLVFVSSFILAIASIVMYILKDTVAGTSIIAVSMCILYGYAVYNKIYLFMPLILLITGLTLLCLGLQDKRNDLLFPGIIILTAYTLHILNLSYFNIGKVADSFGKGIDRFLGFGNAIGLGDIGAGYLQPSFL